ncbi:MAG: energy transducer TonB [Pseudomonadales bacterium]
MTATNASTLTITPRDRLGFTLFVAASLHAALILGVSFTESLGSERSPTIEVTLATHNDQIDNEDADFIAEAAQLGSGDAAEALERTTTAESEMAANEFNEVIPDPMSAVEQTVLEERVLLATEIAREDQVADEKVDASEANNSQALIASEAYETLAQEIASLEARIAQEQQADAKGPRVKRLSSVSTKSAAEAAYLNMWRQKVERIGNANYPAGVFGSLRMLVIIREDGTLDEVRLLDSSGHKNLDEAALRIVRLAAPYPEFSVAMRKDYEVLEIIRTWQFSQGGRLDS